MTSCLATFGGAAAKAIVRAAANVAPLLIFARLLVEFSVANTLDREAIIASSDIPGLRLFAVQKNGTNAANPLDLADVQQGGWVQSSPKTVCGSEYDSNQTNFCTAHCGPSTKVPSFKRNTWGYFSAVCFVHGRALVKATGRPQGMLASNWGECSCGNG